MMARIDQESPLFKYFIVINENNTAYPVRDYESIMKKEEYRHEYIKIILINDKKRKKIESRDELIRMTANNHTEVA